MDTQKYLILDYETRSKADLFKSGGVEYALHPSTEILCVSWRLGTRAKLREQLKAGKPAPCWSPKIPSSYGEFKRALFDTSVILVAHSALFEQMITRHVLSRLIHDERLKCIPVSRWVCTAALAGAQALPKSLEGACLALGLRFQKDMEGRRLMLKLCKPRRVTKHDSRVWHNKLSDLKRVMQYCASDTDAETELFLRLPALNPTERKVWELDQLINQRGFYVDRPFVDRVLKLIELENENIKRRVTALTGGEITSTNRVAAIHEWLSKRGCHLPDLRASTIRDALAAGLAEGDALKMLKLRQMAAKSSTKKYSAFEMRSRSDSRVRDILSYHRAHTGRWGGVGVQPQNFPRPTIKNVEEAVDTILRAREHEALGLIRMLHGNPLDVFASTLRSVITATPGCALFDGDFSTVEVRVLFWMAGEGVGLSELASGAALYEAMAAIIYGVSADDIGKDSPERQIGKNTVLGCGFGMGPPKFQVTAKVQTGVTIDDATAKRAVGAYRRKYKRVPEMWSNIEKAAIYATRHPGKTVKVNRTAWFMKGTTLYCELPSGRRLAYPGAKVQFDPTPWEEKRPVLYHWGVNSKTHQWEFSGTYGGRLTENVVQAVARDLMACAMLRLEAAQYRVVLTVHDEVLTERTQGYGSVEEFEEIMAENPAWAEGLPTKVGVWSADRYRK